MFEDEVQVPEYVGPRCKCFSVFKDIPGVPIKRLPQPQLACCCLICHTPHTLIIHPSFRDFYAFQLVSKIIGSCIYSFGKKSVVFLVSRSLTQNTSDFLPQLYYELMRGVEWFKSFRKAITFVLSKKKVNYKVLSLSWDV